MIEPLLPAVKDAGRPEKHPRWAAVVDAPLVVERTFAWITARRRLARHDERDPPAEARLLAVKLIFSMTLMAIGVDDLGCGRRRALK